jgi:hypothetical protein
MSGQGAAIGAAVGATYNAARGKDPVKGALAGAAIGATGGYMGIPGLAGPASLAGTTTVTGASTAANLTPAAAGTTAGTATGSAITAGAGGSAAGNLTAVPSFGVPSFQVGASGVPSAGVFSTPAQVSTFQPLSSAAGQTASMEKTFGPIESLLNPNIKSSSLAPTFMEKLGSGVSEVGKYAEKNPVLTAMAMQTGQSLLQQREPQLQSPGLMRGTQMQVAAPQYQVGIPKVSLI